MLPLHLLRVLRTLVRLRPAFPSTWASTCAALALLLLTTTGIACGGDGLPGDEDAARGIAVAPGQLIFNPQTESIEVTLTNTSTDPVMLGDFRVEGSDWEAFSIADPLDPRPLPPGQSLAFQVVADPAFFQGPEARAESIVAPLDFGDDERAEEVDPDAYRDGTARLTFSAAGERVKVPVTFEDPSWVWVYLIPALVKIHILVLAFIMPLASLLTWMERKQSAMMQDRLGPNMARLQLGNISLRLWGLLHIATDGIKMLFKEDFIPRRAHRWMYTLAPLMALAPALVVFAIVPFGDALCYGQAFDVVSQADVNQCADGRGGTPLQIAQIDVGLLFYFAIASLATWGTTLAGWSSYNKWAILGALRASAQMISYEVAIGLTIVGALLVYGTLEPHALVHAQRATYWGIALQPAAFILFFTAAIAETKRAPFDLPEGESEIIGYFIEYSGMRFGLFFLSEFIEIVFVSALITTLFLGGWTLPFGILEASGFSSPMAAQLFLLGAGTILTLTGAAIWRAARQGELVGAVLALVGILHLMGALWSAFTGWGTALPHIVVVLIGMITWGIKVLLLCWLQLLIRWTLPRFRYDQLMSLGWKGLLPLSVANIVLTAVVVYFLYPSTGAVDVPGAGAEVPGQEPPSPAAVIEGADQGPARGQD